MSIREKGTSKTPRFGGYESDLFAACGKMPPINTHLPTRASRSTCKQA